MSIRKLVRGFQKKFTRSFVVLNLMFITGFLIGVYAHVRNLWAHFDVVSLDYLVKRTEVMGDDRNSSIAETLHRVVRLHCALFGNEVDKEKTWYPRCNSFSSTNNSYTTWKEAMGNAYVEFSMNTDWFIFTDANAFVIPENVRLFLLPFVKSKDRSLIFASWTEEYIWPFMIVSVGALRRIYMNTIGLEVGTDIPAVCDFNSTTTPTPWCLLRHGMKLIETRDQLKRHRILPYPPSTLMNTSSTYAEDINVRELVHQLQFGPQCCSSTAFAILSLHPYFHGGLYYLIYIAHTRGDDMDYGNMTTREKLTAALRKAKEGLPPTVLL